MQASVLSKLLREVWKNSKSGGMANRCIDAVHLRNFTSNATPGWSVPSSARGAFKNTAVSSVGGCQAPTVLKYQSTKAPAYQLYQQRFWSAGESGPSGFFSTVRQRIGWLRSRPKELANAAKQSAENASLKVYKKMPEQAKLWVDSAGEPGAMRRVAGLQLEAFMSRYYTTLLAVGGVFLVYAAWRTIFGMAKFFVNLSDTVAASGFLALAASMVAFGFLYLRHRLTINPASIYRMALSKLNTNPGVLEVMGAPVAGSELRAYIMTGGQLRFKNLRPRWRSKRCQMIFPLTGSQRRGLVSLEAKKRRGVYSFKLLAVDVPSAGGGEQRIFLEGDEATYNKGGVLNDLRSPFLKALSLSDTYEAEDEAEDQVLEQQEEQKKLEAKAERAAKAPKALDEGGGMYVYERVYYWLRGLTQRLGGKKAAEATQQLEVSGDAALGQERGAPRETHEKEGGGMRLEAQADEALETDQAPQVGAPEKEGGGAAKEGEVKATV